MRRTDFTTVVVPVGGETTNTVLTGHGSIKRHIVRVICDIVANAAVVVYLDQDRLVLLDTALLPPLEPYVDIDVDLPPGVTLTIGYSDLGVAGHAAMNIGYQWEE